MYYSIKTYGTDRGLSCCFRQWRAEHSHCRLVHGYSVGVEFIWQSPTLDKNNWAFDFGGMAPIKKWLEEMFDHTILVAKDDPDRRTFEELHVKKLVDLRLVETVGCEGFAKLIYDKATQMLQEMKQDGQHARYDVGKDVTLKSVKVFEHAGNAAIYESA